MDLEHVSDWPTYHSRDYHDLMHALGVFQNNHSRVEAAVIHFASSLGVKPFAAALDRDEYLSTRVKRIRQQRKGGRGEFWDAVEFGVQSVDIIHEQRCRLTHDAYALFSTSSEGVSTFDPKLLTVQKSDGNSLRRYVLRDFGVNAIRNLADSTLPYEKYFYELSRVPIAAVFKGSDRATSDDAPLLPERPPAPVELPILSNEQEAVSN